MSRNKYSAIRTTVDGITFASKAEAGRYQMLCLLQQAGAIRNLTTQKRYTLAVAGITVGSYVSDFEYDERHVVTTPRPFTQRAVATWEHVTEDVKGVKTPVYRLKKKLMKAIHGIDIRETR